RAVNGGKLPVSALGVRAIDPHTLEIKLEHPWPVLPDYESGVGGMFMAPAPRHVIERWGDAWIKPEHFVGNGPYVLTSWKLGDKIAVRKNPLYYGAKDVCIDRINYYPTNDAVSAERRVKRGELDLNGHIQANRINFLRRPDQMPAYVHTHLNVGLYYMEFNIHDVPVLRDKRVRQALGMAIDREFITEKLVRGGQQPAYSLVPPGMVDYSGGAETYWAKWPLAKRQAEAKRLLAEAGYGPKRPLKLEIKHRNTADPMLIMPAVQADWKSVGVLASLAANEVQVAYAAYNAGDFEVADAGWGGGADAMGFLYLHRADAGTQNYGRYYNPRFDALLDAANQERDNTKREAFLRQAEQLLLDDMPAVPIYYLAKSAFVTPQLTGWTDNQFDTHRARFFCFKDAAARRAAATGR
ncbi:MAG: peptide ABC transporter substrate-binding protein, partial [Caulobacteraceae bacterium]